jgi:hypothetical protein
VAFRCDFGSRVGAAIHSFVGQLANVIAVPGHFSPYSVYRAAVDALVVGRGNDSAAGRRKGAKNRPTRAPGTSFAISTQ